MKNKLMIQSQLLIILTTFLLLLPKLFIQKSDSKKIFLSSEIKDSTNKVEIYKIISPLNSNKSCGPNSIQIKVLCLFQDQISTILQLFAIDHFPQEFFLIF